ncbi:hypothetical protein D1007_40943 [Hordeum vulgare]|nr:hypothetical protein D1007_40943 [Hordeum vulgare]
MHFLSRLAPVFSISGFNGFSVAAPALVLCSIITSADTPPPDPTSISSITHDLLREIFHRLPDLPTLVRAAFTCRHFVRLVLSSSAFCCPVICLVSSSSAFCHPFVCVVHSSTAFRCRFRELHAPPLLALFPTPYMQPITPSTSRSSDPDTTATFADLLRDDEAFEWGTDSQIF